MKMKPACCFAVLLLLGKSMDLFVETSPLPNPVPADSDVSPDIYTMLGFFKGDQSIASILQYLQEFKTGADLLATLMKESPPLQQVIQTASKTNVKVRVLMNFAEGKFPDLRDLFQLATENTSSIYSSLDDAFRKNPQWKEFSLLIEKKGFTSSYEVLSKVISLYTGGLVVLSPSVLHNIENDKYAVHAGPDDDLVEMLEFINDNFFTLRQNINLFLENPSNFTTLAENILSLNLAHFPGLKPQQNIQGDKYTVSGGAEPNPDATKLLEEFNHLKMMTADQSADESEIKASILNLTIGFVKYLNMAVDKAETAARSGESGKLSQPSGVVG